jgi:hypothetical protein
VLRSLIFVYRNDILIKTRLVESAILNCMLVSAILNCMSVSAILNCRSVSAILNCRSEMRY